MKKKYVIFYNGGAFMEDSIDEVNRFVINLKKINRYYRNGLIVADLSDCEIDKAIEMGIEYGYLYGCSENSLTLRDKMRDLYADYMIDIDELE